MSQLSGLETVPTTSIHYEVTVEGPQGSFSYYSPSGYSKYNDRYKAYHNGDLQEPVYGLEQALEHIDELRESVYEGKQNLKDTVFLIRKVITTRSLLAVVNKG